MRINQELTKYDKRLYAVRSHTGLVQVFREGERADSTDIDLSSVDSFILRPHPQLILSLTDTWTANGRPVEWGIEPICKKIREMDSWRDDSHYERMLDLRERDKKDKDRSNLNEFRAVAADMRRDFARATNDIVVQKQ